MPELTEFAEALRTDLDVVKWPAADEVRTRGDRRRRRGLARVVTVAVGLVLLAVLASVVVRPAGRSIPGAPVGEPTSTGGGPCPSDGCARWSAAVLLPADVGYGMSLTGQGDRQPLNWAALNSCPDSSPLGHAYGEGSGGIFLAPDGGQFSEMINQVPAGKAVSGIDVDLPARLAGACADSYALVSRDFAGSASALLRDKTVLPTEYEAFVAQDGFLIWLRLRVSLPPDDLFALTRELAVKAAAKLHCMAMTTGDC